MNFDVLLLDHHEGNPRNSEGSFIELEDQHLLFTYSRYQGTSPHDNANADIALRESFDGGRTWSSEDRIIVDHSVLGVENIMSTSMLKLAGGRVLLFVLIKFKSADGSMNCIPSMAYSDDQGKSWSEPEMMLEKTGYFILCNDRVMELKNGKLVAPIATSDSRVTFWMSDDQGKSWYQATPLISPDKNPCTIFQEPGIIELNDGRLWSYFRTEVGCQYGMWSDDDCRSWSTPEPMKDFISPMAPMTVKRNPVNGKLLAVWDDHADRWDVPPPEYTRPGWGDVPTGGRFPLVLAESSDEGKSWHNARRLEKDTRRGFCYPAIYFTSDAVLLAYCCGGLNDTIMLQDMKIVRIPMTADGSLMFEGV